MAEVEEMNDQRMSRLERWKSELEHLNMQLHLGRAEAKEAFEKQKGELREWVDEAGEWMDDVKEDGAEKMTDAKRKLEELRVQAALGRADTIDALHEEQKELSQKMHDMKYSLEHAYQEVKEDAGDLSEDIGYKFEDLKTRFDMFWLHTSLGAMEAGDAWERRKKDISSDLHELKLKLEKGKDVAEDRWDNFSKEMTEAWRHFIGAFKS